MSRTKVPQVHLSGNSYEIGLTHGRLLAAQIHGQIDIYRDIFLENCNFEWPRVLQLAERYRAAIGSLTPDLLDEMQGIADGVDDSNVGLLDIVAINARSEIALGLWDDGCTSVAWNLGNSRKQVLAQNWDFKRAIGKNLVMAHIKQIGKPEIWYVLEPGLVGKIGFNSASVGVLLNAIRASPTSSTLLPIHCLLRIALYHDSVPAAITAIERLGGAASTQHILIADASTARGLELSPNGGVYLKPDADGIIVHTNHLLENKLVREPEWLSGSPVRLERARTLCAEIVKNVGKERLGEAVTPAFLRGRVFSDTFNSPQAICCSPHGPTGSMQDSATLFNIIMVLESGKTPQAEVVFGRPGTEEQGEVYHLPW